MVRHARRRPYPRPKKNIVTLPSRSRPTNFNKLCRRPHETAPVHRLSPPSRDGRYGKTDASVTGSTHANHRSARSPRPTPEGPARDNPVAGPRTGTTRSKPRVPASAGASGRHNEFGSRPASVCPAQPPSKAGGASPWGGERHHGVRKADRSTESHRTGRGTAHHAGATRHAREARRRPQPRHTDRCQAATAAGCRRPGKRAQNAPNHGTGTGAKQHQPPSGWTSARSEGTQPLPATNSRRPDGRVRARRVPNPYRLRSAAVRMDECAPGGYPAPTGYEQPPSGWTSERPAATPHTRNTAHATHSTSHRGSTPVNKSQAAQDTVRATQPTERAHR